jgi:hypothetical protein
MKEALDNSSKLKDAELKIINETKPAEVTPIVANATVTLVVLQASSNDDHPND